MVILHLNLVYFYPLKINHIFSINKILKYRKVSKPELIELE